MNTLECDEIRRRSPNFVIGWVIDQITIKRPCPKCRLYWCLIEFIDWRYSRHDYIDPSCKLAPLYLLSSSPTLLPCVNKYRSSTFYRVCNGGGGVYVESIYRRNTLCIWPDSESTKLLYTVYLTRFRIYKIALPPQTNLGGEGASDTCRQVPLLVNFLEKPTFRVCCLYRYLVHGMGKAKDRSGVREGRGLAEGKRGDWGKWEKHVVKTLKPSLHRMIQSFFIHGPFNTENINIYLKPKTCWRYHLGSYECSRCTVPFVQ